MLWYIKDRQHHDEIVTMALSILTLTILVFCSPYDAYGSSDNWELWRKCDRAMTACVTIDPGTLLPEQDNVILGNFTTDLVNRTCRFLAESVSCHKTVLETVDGCRDLKGFGYQAAGIEIMTAVHPVVCQGQGLTDVLSLLPCAQNQGLQKTVYGRIMNLSGQMKALAHCGNDNAQEQCSALKAWIERLPWTAHRFCGMDAARTANKLLLQLKDMELPLEQDGKRINCTLGEGYYGLINGA